jgi:ATP-dependent Lon protease
MTPKNNNTTTSANRKRDEKSRLRRRKESDSDSSSEEEWMTESSDYEEESETEDEEEVEFDRKKYKKFLAEMFPSKYSKKMAEEEEDEDDDESYENSDDDKESDESSKHKKSKKIQKRNRKDKKSDKDKKKSKKSSTPSSKSKKSSSNKKTKSKSKNKKESDEENTEDDESVEEEYSEEEEENNSTENSESDSDSDSESSDDDDNTKHKKEGKINIILSLGEKDEDDYADEYAEYFGHELDDEDDDDDDDCDTDDEETFMKEKFEKVVQPEQDSDSKSSNDKDGKKDKKKKDKKNKKNKEEEEDIPVNVESEYIELLELKKDLTRKLHKNPKSKILKKAIAECSEDIKKLVKDARKKNTKEYKKLLSGDKTKPNEMNYFKKKMSNAEQLKIMKELKEVNQFMDIEKPYRLALLESTIPPKLKAIAMQKLNMLRMMDETDSEYFKLKNWVDTFMKIPFCKYSNLNISMKDGIEKCHEFMLNAKSVLDNCVYGLDDAKLQILQMLGQWISNPDAMGTAIAIKGPPGTGKTTLVKDGISKILGREFVFIPLGGAGDSSFLEGHSYTYEGSTWGKIVQSLINCKCMNPVFYFDELDKISDTPKGEEITGILTHLTDTTQNSQFHDKYFSDVDFDLSKCLFIFSYNDESRVNPILKDRMYNIHTKGYDSKEKVVIANQYMLPKIREQVGFKNNEVIIPEDTIKYITSSQHLTHNESGVRNMKRCLEIIHTKLNLFRLVKSDDNLFSKQIDIRVEFPFTVTNKDVDVLIKNEEKQSQSLLSMYI